MFTTTPAYDGELLAGRGNDDAVASEQLALSLDARIPRDKMGLVLDVLNPATTRASKLYSLRWLCCYVPIMVPVE